jgi:hypothetical protein
MKIARWTLVAVFVALGIYAFMSALTAAMLSGPPGEVRSAFAEVRAENRLFVSLQMLVNAVIFFFLLRPAKEKA